MNTNKKTIKKTTKKKTTKRNTATRKHIKPTTNKQAKQTKRIDIDLLTLEEITEQAKQVLPTLDDTIQPPKDILPNKGTRKLYIERYNKKIATLLLIEIATNAKETIIEIVNSFGFDIGMINKWKLLNSNFKASYALAVEYRQDIVLQESIPARLDKIDSIMEDTELTPQDKNVRIQALNQRIKYTQWLSGKLNKKYADNTGTGINQQITINAGTNRAASYTEHRQEVKD